MAVILIGIDDTDNDTSPGTGRLARDVAAECCQRGLTLKSVTRHQFLLDPAIAYTSHNSGACVALEGPADLDRIRFVVDYVAERSAPGSDPGVCLALLEEICESTVILGKSAAKTVLTIKQIFDEARGAGIALYGVGGTCDGVIGAFCSVGQFAGGQDGRYIDLPGLRDLAGRVDCDTVKSLGIDLEYVDVLRYPLPSDEYDTCGWVRPNLKNHRPVWAVEWSEQDHAWNPVDRKRSRPLE
jgi:hypothetical protein